MGLIRGLSIVDSSGGGNQTKILQMLAKPTTSKYFVAVATDPRSPLASIPQLGFPIYVAMVTSAKH